MLTLIKGSWSQKRSLPCFIVSSDLVVVPEHVVAPDDGQGQHQGEEEHQQGRGHEAEHRAGERRQAGAAATKHS